jgi:hypothetical protein
MRRLLRRRLSTAAKIRGQVEVDAPITVVRASLVHNAHAESRSIVLAASPVGGFRVDMRIRNLDELLAELQSARGWLSGEDDDSVAVDVDGDRVDLVHELMTAAKFALFGEAEPGKRDQLLYDQIAAALDRAATP